MPDLPALPLGAPLVGRRATRASPRPRLEGPGAPAQEARLAPRLQRLTDAFTHGRLATPPDPAALPPEQVIVLEIAGELGDFAKAVRRIPGLEFLAEEAEERLDADADFVALGRDGRRHGYTRQLFLVASDAVAWQQLLELWQRYKRGDAFPRGLTPFRDLFARLRDVRAWDDRDRLERTGALAAWREDLVGMDSQPVEFEAELWLRGDERRRESAIAGLGADLAEVGGTIVDQLVVEEIDYHGVLARVPARHLLEAAAHREVRWLRTDSVRFFHAVGQIVASPPGEDQEPADDQSPPGAVAPAGAPRIALLDGLPFAGHSALAGRLVVDDPAGWDATIPVAERRHGTGMASVIVHGDLNAPATPASRPVYVRPILVPGPSWVRDVPEELPRDRLAIDIINGAVTRLFAEPNPAAPEVRVIVLAVGNKVEQFDRFISPLARLLDWLSFKHGVLFVVSAGNHVTVFDVPADLGLEDPRELQHEVLCAMQRATGLRRILAPGESVNAVTVGAAHADTAPAHADDRLDPMVTGDLPNVVTANGPGVRRAVKPDILLPGGRQLVRLEPAQGDARRALSVPNVRRGPGVRMAAPPRSPGQTDATVHATGTSVATAFGGHHAGHVLDELDDLRARHGGQVREGFDAVLVKAALAHAARWATAIPFIDEASDEVIGRRTRDAVARMVGYGLARPNKALRCDDHRVTALAAGEIAADEAHTFRFPLPASLGARAVHRRLTLTLAWLTPVNPQHRAYRRAALGLQPTGVELTDERLDVDFNGTRRGTLQHNVLDGARAVPYAGGDAIELVVACRADAGSLDDAVPYALIATLEVPAAIGLPIYDEVRQALHVPIQTPVPIAVRTTPTAT
jgi:hypothetical protein